MPTRPEHVNDIISQYIKAKVPHFFIYAKDKELKNVELLNDSTVNKLHKIIPTKAIQFKKIAGIYDSKMLMINPNVNLNSKIINKYNELNKNKRWKFNDRENAKTYQELYIYKYIREEILMINSNEEYVVDVLVKYLYENKNSKNKETLWKAFGDILLSNLKQSLNNTKQCECCGKRTEIINSQSRYCDDCSKEIKKIKTRERVRNHRKRNALSS
jgi:hypothetical protein